MLDMEEITPDENVTEQARAAGIACQSAVLMREGSMQSKDGTVFDLFNNNLVGVVIDGTVFPVAVEAFDDMGLEATLRMLVP